MGKRFKDWLNQAESDLEHAKKSLEMEDYNWACFAAQQCAEKALKAFYDFLGREGLGHRVVKTRQKISFALAEDNRFLLEALKGIRLV